MSRPTQFQGRASSMTIIYSPGIFHDATKIGRSLGPFFLHARVTDSRLSVPNFLRYLCFGYSCLAAFRLAGLVRRSWLDNLVEHETSRNGCAPEPVYRHASG